MKKSSTILAMTLMALYFTIPAVAVTFQSASSALAENNDATLWRAPRAVLTPTLELSKTATPLLAQPGGLLTYTLWISNVGDPGSTAQELVITDALPLSTTWAWGGDYADGVVTFDTPSSVAWGSPVSVTWAVVVQAPFGGQVLNALYGARSAETPSATLGPPISTNVADLDLSVEKSGSPYAVIGENLVYTITLHNEGLALATGVLLTDTLPQGLTYLDDGSGYTPSQISPGVYAWDLGDLPAATSRSFNLTVTVDGDVASGAVLLNQVQVSTSAEGDSPHNNSSTYQTTAYELLTIAEARLRPYGEIFAVVGYVNFPPGLLYDPHPPRDQFTIQDAPLGATGIDVYHNGATLAPLSEGDQVFVAGALGEDEYSRQRIVLAAPTDVYALGANAALTPLALASGDVGPATEGVLVQVQGQALGASANSLTLDDGSGPVKVYPDSIEVALDGFSAGDYVRVVGLSSWLQEYRVLPRFQDDLTELPRVLSTSPSDGAGEVSVNASLQATFNMTVVNVSNATFTLDGPSGPVSGQVAYDAASLTATFDPDARLAFESAYTATLKQSIANPDGETLYQDHVWTFSTSAPRILVQKSAPALVYPGDWFTYTISVVNETALDLSNLVITDVVPENTALVNVLDGGAALGDAITWTASALNNGDSLQARFVVSAAGPLAVAHNDEYYAWASEWLTPETGPAVETVILGGLAPIGVARGLAGYTVTIQGRATMYSGGSYPGATKFYLQDDSGGIAVFCQDSAGDLPTVQLGDLVTVTGQIVVDNGEVQMRPTDNVNDVLLEGGSLSDVPTPLLLDISEVKNADALGWLVTIQGEAVLIQEHPLDYEIDLSDGLGHKALVHVAKYTGIDVSDVRQGRLYTITGIADKCAGKNCVKPRIQPDVYEIIPPTLRIEKSGPALTVQDQVFEYTLLATNNTSFELNDVVINDVFPADNAALSSISDGGALQGDAISWTLDSLAPGAQWHVHFAMTATGAVGSRITNTNFSAWASNWLTHESGSTVHTEITAGCAAGYTPIFALQGSGSATPYSGQVITTCGVVVGVAANLDGVFIQDTTGDGLSNTSDAVFVYRGVWSLGDVAPGDLVEVSGAARELEGCTQVNASGAAGVLNVVANRLPLPVAVALDPPPTRAEADVYLEPLEAMLAQIPLEANVVGPTDSGGELAVTRADSGVTRLVLQTDPPDGYRLVVGAGMRALGDFKVGDVLSDVRGPLHFQDGDWKIEQLQALDLVSSPELPAWPSLARAASNQFSVGAFNVSGLDGGDAVKLDKVASAIEALGAPLLLSLQDIAVTDVMTALVDSLAAQGYSYAYLTSRPDSDGYGVALLYDVGRVSVSAQATLQTCSVHGSSDSVNDDLWSACQALGQYPLFARRPVVVSATLEYDGEQTPVVLIANQFSAAQPERRLAQANFVAGYAASQISGGANVIVAGDLSAALDSPALNALYVTGTLTNTLYALPPEARYTYVRRGVSQAWDHVLVSPALWEMLESLTPLHVNSDYPAAWETDASTPYGAAEHDPLLARFNLPAPVLLLAKSVFPTTGVALNDVVTYTITLENNGTRPARGVALTDVLPLDMRFGGWLEKDAAAQVSDPPLSITWGAEVVPAGARHTLRFTATTPFQVNYYGQTINNVVYFGSDNAGAGSDGAPLVINAPDSDLVASKTSSADGLVQPGDLVVYTVVLRSHTLPTVTARITDVLGSYYSVYGAPSPWTESPSGTLTWQGTVAAGRDTVLQFVAQVSKAADTGEATTLHNVLQVSDGQHALFEVRDALPPWVATQGVYLPLLIREGD